MCVSAVQWSESAVSTHISPSSWPFLPPPPAHLLGHHRGWVELPVPNSIFEVQFGSVAQSCLTLRPHRLQRYFTIFTILHIVVYIYVNPNLPVLPTLPFLQCVHRSVLYICISIPALQIGWSVLLFRVQNIKFLKRRHNIIMISIFPKIIYTN